MIIELEPELVFDSNFISGVSDIVMVSRDWWVQRMLNVCTIAPPALVQKTFKPKFSLPVLSDYSKAAPEWFWDRFPKNYVCPAVSLIDGMKLKELATLCQYPDKQKLDKVVQRIITGAEIGCE